MSLMFGDALMADPCVYCGEPTEALDHIDPRHRGGRDGWLNRIGICASCNSRKGTRSLLAHLLMAANAREPLALLKEEADALTEEDFIGPIDERFWEIVSLRVHERERLMAGVGRP